MSLSVRIAEPSDAPQIHAAYERWNYSHHLAPDDVFWLAEDTHELIGMVRIAYENGVHVLRGMRVAPQWQRRGVGTRILRSVALWLGKRECYCIPYRYLVQFYERAGFREVAPETGPTFLKDRLKDYRRHGLDVILMLRSGDVART